MICRIFWVVALNGMTSFARVEESLYIYHIPWSQDNLLNLMTTAAHWGILQRFTKRLYNLVVLSGKKKKKQHLSKAFAYVVRVVEETPRAQERDRPSAVLPQRDWETGRLHPLLWCREKVHPNQLPTQICTQDSLLPIQWFTAHLLMFIFRDSNVLAGG